MLKIGVLGAGHLGKIHLRCLAAIENYHLIGFHDPDPAIAETVAAEFGLKAFDSLHQLIEAVDVVDIVTPTVAHFGCAAEALKMSKHVFIEKPIVTTPSEALDLMKIAAEAGVKVQVGHVERFNPAFMAARQHLNQPMFIETHRLAMFNPRGTDVPVILDLMIHDIDIVLSVVKSPVKRISASGVAIVSDTPDIANARLEFDNGCVANLTASRLSLKNMRKSRFFQRDAYISVDFLSKEFEIVRIADSDPSNPNPLAMTLDLGSDKGVKEIQFEKPEVTPINAIQTELAEFALSIINDTPPPVTIDDGYLALEVAHRIINKLNR
ncbi:MAG: Gfo/Idh/MocA family oxidoreductase [Bacteroidales bacterium]|jgi:predicted dehydrogenase|nr:Gfo/Idh/MocA family oxidoreductase [Bacteroidales bacterium]MDD3663892.1 Gfo/Idh/MocA family oxidoreductase [Bacteroidales bacterium]